MNYKFERLYRILFNEEMYYVAYQRIYAKPGNMTAGTDGQTIDLMNLTRIERLIASLKDESYQPKPSKRVYIPKKNGKPRPLGVPTFNDKLLQEVVRVILEAIYEGHFEDTSHGFRPKRSCHTALADIQKTFSGVKWFVEGDIKGFFDNINHEILIDILRERISDDRFIRLIRKFLNAGYVENWIFHNSYSGTPQGGINKRIRLMIGKDTVKKKLLEYRVLEIKIHNSKEQWKAKSRPKLVNNNDLEILEKYNKEIRGLYNYYALANNCSIRSKLSYIMQYSFTQKYRTKVSQIKKKYRKNGHFTVRYRLKNGVLKDLAFYHDGFKKKNPIKVMNTRVYI